MRKKGAAESCVCCNPAGFVWPNYPDSDEEGADEEEDDMDSDEEERRERVEEEEAVREGRVRRRAEDGAEDDEDEDDEDEEEEDDEDDAEEHARQIEAAAANAIARQARHTAATTREDGQSNRSSFCACGSATSCAMVRLPASLCGASGTEPHYAHTCCLARLRTLSGVDSGADGGDGVGSNDCTSSGGEAPPWCQASGGFGVVRIGYPGCPRCTHRRTQLALGADDEEWTDEWQPNDGLVISRQVTDANRVSFGGMQMSSKMLTAIKLVREVSTERQPWTECARVRLCLPTGLPHTPMPGRVHSKGGCSTAHTIDRLCMLGAGPQERRSPYLLVVQGGTRRDGVCAGRAARRVRLQA